jgi:hypothetical protein
MLPSSIRSATSDLKLQVNFGREQVLRIHISFGPEGIDISLFHVFIRANLIIGDGFWRAAPMTDQEQMLVRVASQKQIRKRPHMFIGPWVVEQTEHKHLFGCK